MEEYSGVFELVDALGTVAILLFVLFGFVRGDILSGKVLQKTVSATVAEVLEQIHPD